MDLRGQVAIVTGAGRGIGRAIAEALARRGASVSLSARTASEIDEGAASLAGAGGRTTAIVADVRRFADCERLVAETVRRLGRLDIVVNNAGIGLHAPVVDTDPQAFENVLATNTLGPFHVTRAALPHLLKQESGAIVQIASLAGTRGTANLSAYCASKFALLGFTEALMLEVRPSNIKVAAICPGSVDTSFLGNRPMAWKLQAQDVVDAVLYVLDSSPGALPSRIELRPLKPER